MNVIITNSACFSSSDLTGDGLFLSDDNLRWCLGDEALDLRLGVGVVLSDGRLCGVGDTEGSFSTSSSSASLSES